MLALTLGLPGLAFGTGLPNAQCFQIELNNTLHILAVGTHGRGAWEISTGAAAPGAALHRILREIR